MEEIWKPVVGYEGLYEVSNLGRVKSLEKYVVTGINIKYQPEQILKQTKDKSGYCRVNLYKDQQQQNCKIHRLVAIAFIPNPDNKLQIDHINRLQKDNNNVNNLRWATGSENQRNREHKLSKSGQRYIYFYNNLFEINAKGQKRYAKSFPEAIKLRDEILSQA
jgi:hypothetical protein